MPSPVPAEYRTGSSMDETQPGHDRSRWRRALETLRRPVARAAALLLLAAAAHGPALRAAFIIDDAAYITEDPRMGSLAGLGRIWTGTGDAHYQHQYYPLTSTLFWIEHRL